jgi:hypothetical protein
MLPECGSQRKFINPVTEYELFALIQNLSSNKSPGPDKIAPGSVKIAAPSLIEPLLHIYNPSTYWNCTGQTKNCQGDSSVQKG